MTWSLPLATADYPPPKRPIINAQGQVIPQSYLYNLADIASRLLELDNICSAGKSLQELSNAVVSTDHELRSLVAHTPKSWWSIQWSELSIDALLQYWHQYLTVRTHLQLALTYDEGKQQFAIDFISCFDACQELARRYISLRPLLSDGFFLNWIVDLQAFTSVIFLLLATYRITHHSGGFMQAVDIGFVQGLIEQVVQLMGSTGGQTGEFANQAGNAIRSLGVLLEQPQAPESERISLRIPLVGKVHVSRKSQALKGVSGQHYPTPGQPQQGPWESTSNYRSGPVAQEMASKTSNFDFMDSLSYSMEIPETYPFLTDENFGEDQWLTLSGWNESSSTNL